MIFVVLHLFSAILLVSSVPCAPRNINGDPNYMVCVCNATYCDDLTPIGDLTGNRAVSYVTSKSGKRFDRTDMQWTNNIEVTSRGTPATIRINASGLFQSMIGFGGAFTDAAGINIKSLSDAAQQNFMQSYFGSNGIEYTLGRVPMAGCDFSTREYSYNDVDGDFNMTNFALTDEDMQYKIPIILRASQLTNNQLKLFSSPWSAPGWMKTTGSMHEGGSLRGFVGGPYYQAWATYFTKFLDAYYSNNVTIWGMTVQNEPTQGSNPGIQYESMYYSADMERDFIKNTLGPALSNHPLGRNVALMFLDDGRNYVTEWSNVILGDPLAKAAVAGLAMHWYTRTNDYASLTDAYHKYLYPDKFILATEVGSFLSTLFANLQACDGWVQPLGPKLGDWSRGEHYLQDIINDVNNFASGWTDWNIALDMQGGPNWVNNFVDSPIIVNAASDEFYKQPMFYAMGHFSKFVRPNSTRIGISIDANAAGSIEGSAFIDGVDNKRRIVVLRNADTSTTYDLQINDVTGRNGQSLSISIEPQSFVTVVWNSADN